ncbi:MAG: hypothetical protein WAV73_02635 [Candidatus Moraniibacteriota bacterium]
MASQIAHIVYAKKYFDKIENGKTDKDFLDEEKINRNHKINRDEFLLGSVFPDIRRIEPSIKRKDTHLKFQPLDLNFSGLTSFEAGWKFHLYCDMRRDEILNAQGFFKLEKTTELFGHPAKFLEDELLYDYYNNWEKLANYFRNPPLVNLEIKADRPTFVLWYAVLAKYIEKKPDEKSVRIFLSKQLSLSQKTEDITVAISALRKNRKVVEGLKKVLSEIV